MRRLTFVIPNYNYREFVGAAIRSALAVRWSDVEVIVVDDGSTDDSVDVVARFGHHVQLIQQRNQGPRIACNVGFEASTGDWVVFLDSDDLVDPEVGEIIESWDRAGVSKIQFQMRRVDANGRVVGSPFPRYPREIDSATIRRWMRTTASYPTPPGSGNAYSRTFLEQLFPLDGRCGDAADSACLAAAPFLGEVLTVNSPTFSYRVHGRNRSYLLADVGQFERHLARALQRHRFAQELDGHLEDLDWMEPLFRGRHLLQLRVAHCRLARTRSPLPGDSYSRMLKDSIRDMCSPGPERLIQKTLIAAWCLATLLLPSRLAKLLITARFTQPKR